MKKILALIIILFIPYLSFSQENELTQKSIVTGYDEGLFFKSEDDAYKMKFNLLVQPRLQYRNLDQEGDSFGFVLQTARFSFGGNVINPKLKYKLETDFGRTYTGTVKLLDYYLDYSFLEPFNIRIGQFKVPFSRQTLASEKDLLLMDRSIANQEFTLSRDLGLKIYGYNPDKQIGYEVGVFNGNGINNVNENLHFLYLGKISYMPFGFLPYGELIQNVTNMKLALELGGGYNRTLEDFLEDGTANNTVNNYYANLNLILVNEIFSLFGEVFYRVKDPVDIASTNDNTHGWGYFVQAARFLKKDLQLAFRYSQLWTDWANDNDYDSEITPGLNYYIFDNIVKLQLQYTYFVDRRSTASDLTNNYIQTQLQFAF
jgi:hypothetical protein